MDIAPAMLDQWFPLALQQQYVNQLVLQLKGQRGVTRRRAEYFIKLWGYLLLKQQATQQPLSQLQPLQGAMVCTNREAAELFYADAEQGSDRAAGMMIDQLVQAGLIEKNFDGNTNLLVIRSVPSLIQMVNQTNIALQPDDFNPRTDAIPVATFLSKKYTLMTDTPGEVAHKISRLLRQWALQYPKAMRVLRRQDTSQAVGFYVLFPVAAVSESNFFEPPSLSLHFSTPNIADPVVMATPGDPQCMSIFARSWMIDDAYKTFASVCLFLRDTQQTFLKLRADFPNLCDIYAMPIHPSYDDLTQALGFQTTTPDPQSYLSWIYLALDHFLEMDIEGAIAKLPWAEDVAVRM
ncbi:MAG: hypothetical protein MUF49_04650 [Oculatellaceae cyanobacterium Prado106]|jgi:hypothetical protein|nr:hypothetical protein [Oculatellaceae cyanobacterium Prado106]